MSQKLSFMIIGASGYMGLHLFKALSKKYSVKGTYASRPFPTGIQFDLVKSDPKTLPLSGINYAVILSGISKIDFCKTNPELSRKINVSGVQKLLHELKRRGIFPIYASSDGVYPGVKGNYVETSKGLPIHAYGEHRKEVEQFIVNNFKKYCILRFSKVVGFDEKKSDLLFDLYQNLIHGKVLKLIKNQKFQVVSLNDMVSVITTVAQKEITGLYNVANPEIFSRKELAERLAKRLGVIDYKIEEVLISYFNFSEKRATNSSMKIDRFIAATGLKFQSIDEVLNDFLEEGRGCLTEYNNSKRVSKSPQVNPAN
jgi:dTDP-4-dehydrorhamnose reductase